MNPATLEREIEGIEHEINSLKREQAMLERKRKLQEEDEATEAEKRELRAVALDILETAEYRLGGGDLRTLELAITKADIDKDQLGRIKLLAREFLMITI
jgi:hypothetical protein